MSNYKRINYKTYSVKTFDPQVNRMVTCVYLTPETKDQLKEHYFGKLGWEVKEIIKDTDEKQKRKDEHQRQRQASYNKYILKGRTQ